MAKWSETAKKIAIPTLAATLILGGYTFAANLKTASASSDPTAANVESVEQNQTGSGSLVKEQNKVREKEVEKNEAQEATDLADKAKISAQEAEKTALASIPGAKVLKNELGDENGTPVYEVKLTNNGKEFEIKIDATNGKILTTQTDTEEESNDKNSSENENQVPDNDNLQVEE